MITIGFSQFEKMAYRQVNGTNQESSVLTLGINNEVMKNGFNLCIMPKKLLKSYINKALTVPCILFISSSY